MLGRKMRKKVNSSTSNLHSRLPIFSFFFSDLDRVGEIDKNAIEVKLPLHGFFNVCLWKQKCCSSHRK